MFSAVRFDGTVGWTIYSEIVFIGRGTGIDMVATNKCGGIR
jgi:hypothetical protein